MAAGRKLLVPSSLAVLFYLNLLSAFLGEKSAGDTTSEGVLRHSRDVEKTIVEFDTISPPIAADISKRGLLGSRFKVDDGVPFKSMPIIFDPPSLDFREQSVGMPRLETVQLTNPSSSHVIHLNSISGDSPVFHASFFKSKVVKPGESTTFDVVFLARGVGAVHNTLYIHTSMGTFDYRVQGVGVSNPFRLRPLLGARIPLNATYSPQITMYNPFSEPLQISEMYSSGGELHIELMTSQPRGSKSLWEIRPFETKTIARANYFGREATNHTSFIRIKTGHSSSPSIVLPVEVEVSDNSRLYLSRELMDFGIVKSGESKSLPLNVLNSGVQEVHIRSISVQPENPAVDVEYMTTILKSGSKYSKVAVITLHADGVMSASESSGKLVIRVEDTVSHQLEVPYEATILHGSLSYEKSQTLFRVGQPPFTPITREIPLSNQFNVPVVLYDVKLPSKAQEYFTVSSFESPYVLPPKSDWHRPFSIQFIPTSSECSFNTTLKVSTNATYFSIPLFCYDGRVQYTLENPDEDVLDYGILSDADESIKTFAIHNHNPVPIQITSYTVSVGLPHTTVELVSIYPTDPSSKSAGSRRMYSKSSKPPFDVDPGFSALFRVNVSQPHNLGAFSGEILVHTSFQRVTHIPVFYRTAPSGLKVTPERIDFGPVFPYSTSEVPVKINNYFRNAATVTAIKAVPNDLRLFVRPAGDHKHYPRLKPAEMTQIGKAVFDPLMESSESVYLGESSGQPWRSFELSSDDATESDPSDDVDHFSQLWRKWSSAVEQGKHFVNMSLLIQLDVGSEIHLPASASLVWPSLVHTSSSSSSVVEFPTTTIGNSSLQVVEVSNPSNYPITVQPVFLHHYTKPRAIIDLLSELNHDNIQDIEFSKSAGSFAFVDKRKKDKLSTESSGASSVLPPQSKAHHITVAFTPKVEQTASTLLLIRNNLTVLDYVLLQGRGSLGTFTIDDIQPNAEPLMFEFTNGMLEKCHVGPQLEPLKMTKVFRMQNSGSTPLTVHMIGVGGGRCEEYGFSVTNCDKELVIKPNTTRRIEIAFRPDFTLSRVSNTLRVHTSGTELLFPLVATLPQHLLAHCYVTQPRPEWEKTLASVSVYFWILVLFLVVSIALARTNCGRKPKLTYQMDSNLPSIQPTGGKLFDLADITRRATKAIARKITNLKTRNDQPVGTIKSSTSTLPTRNNRRDAGPPDAVSPPSVLTTTTIPSAVITHQTNGSKPHPRDRDQHPPQPHPPSYLSTSPLVVDAATLSHSSSLKGELSSQQSHPHYYSAASSELRLRQTSSTSALYTTSSRKDSPPRQMVLTSSTSPPAVLRMKSSVTTLSSREKAAGSVVTKRAHSPPSVVTEMDKSTGTYSVVAPKHAEDQLSSTSDRKPSDRPEEILSKDEPSQTTCSHGSPHPVSIDALNVSTPPNQRKLKPSRRSGSKIHRPQAPEPKSTPPPANLSAGSANSNAASQVDSSKTEDFIRKESESSLKSTDSESTSSSEKLDDIDDAEPIVSPKVLEVKAQVFHPLAKEPNTGQTVPVTPVSETPDISKGKGTAPEVPKKDKEDTASTVLGRSKGKKRPPRQLLKKDEKPKRKDREREREREKRERGIKEHIRHERANSNEELLKRQQNSGESSSSNSTEQLYEEQNDQRGESQEADDEKSDVSSLPDRDSTLKLNPKPTRSESPKQELPSPDVNSALKTDTSSKKFVEALDSSTPPVLPVPSVPSTAFKTGRAKSTSSKQRSDDGYTEASHRSSKKSISKKSSDRVSKGTVDAHSEKAKQKVHASEETHPIAVTETKLREVEGGENSSSTVRPHTLPVIDVESAEPILVSTDTGSVEVDGVQHKLEAPTKTSQIVPNSPHELAASLLSNNYAIKRRSRQRGNKDQSAEDGHEDGEYDEDESEEGSDGDAHPTTNYHLSSSTHPMMDNSHNKLQEHPSYHYQDPHRHMLMKPPSTLSLDAEPFYPTNFSSKGRQGGRPRMVDPQKYPQEFHHEGPVPIPSRVPPGFSPEDATMYMQQGSYPDKHFKQDYPGIPSGPSPVLGSLGPRSHPLPPLQRHSKTMTPTPSSPPPHGGDVQHFPYMEHPGMELLQENLPGFHKHPVAHRDVGVYDAVKDPEAPSYPPVGGRRRFPDQHRDLAIGGGSSVDTHHPPMSQSGRLVTPTGMGPYHDQYTASLHRQQQRQQQQHMGGGARVPLPPYRMERGEHPPSAFTVASQRSPWENPNPYRLQPLPGEEDLSLLQHQEYLRKRSILLQLYQQEQAALEAAIAREQAKRSVETLSSLNQPYRSRSGVVGGKVDLLSPVGGLRENLWEGVGGRLHDPVVPSSTSFDEPLLSESMMRQRQMHYLASQQPPARSRSFSGESEIGGEFLPNSLQVQSSINQPDLNRAPGPGTSGQSQRSQLDHTASSGWPLRSRTEGSSFSQLWSRDDPSEDTSSLGFASNTYELFENQSIWSNSTSSNLLSWAQYQADPQRQDDKKPES